MRIFLLSGSFLGLVYSSITPAMSVQQPLNTNAEIVDAINKIAPTYTLASGDVPIEEIVAPGATEMDGARLGSFSITASTSSYWSYDSATAKITAASYVDGKWRTFSLASLPSSWNATTTLNVLETATNGGPADGYKISLVLTKAGTGTPADLTRDSLSAFLAKSATFTLTTSGGTALTSTSALITGWTAKAQFENAASTPVILAASSPILDPLSVTVGVPVTVNGTTAPINYAATLSNLDSWNVDTGTPAPKKVLFTGLGSRAIEFMVDPAQFIRTAGKVTGVVNALNASPKMISQTAQSYSNSLPSAVGSVMSIIAPTAPSNIKAGLAEIADAKINTAAFDDAAYTALIAAPLTVGTGGEYGLLSLGSSDISTITWSVDGADLIANGKIGAAAAKDFKCTLASNNINTAGTVLKFAAADGDTFWLKVFTVDTASPSVLDTSGNTDIDASQRIPLLAMQLQNVLSAGSVTTVVHKTLRAIAGA